MTGSLAGPTFSKTKFLNGDYKIEFKCNVQEDRPLLFTWDTPRSGGFYDTHRLYIPVGEYTLEKIKTEDEETGWDTYKYKLTGISDALLDEMDGKRMSISGPFYAIKDAGWVKLYRPEVGIALPTPIVNKK